MYPVRFATWHGENSMKWCTRSVRVVKIDRLVARSACGRVRRAGRRVTGTRDAVCSDPPPTTAALAHAFVPATPRSGGLARPGTITWAHCADAPG
eukprot:scaffold4470_cov255-Prasinococcus_capsulatus_cf.AAC.16